VIKFAERFWLGSNKITKNVLWLDNRIEDYSAIIRGLESRNISVSAVSSLISAMEALDRRERYNVYFLDFLFEGETSLELIKAISSHQPKAIIVIVSGYLFLDNFIARIEEVKRDYPRLRVLQLEKSLLPMPEDEAFDKFVEQVSQLCADDNVEIEVGVAEGDWLASHRNHVDFPAYSDFMALSNLNRRLISMKFTCEKAS